MVSGESGHSHFRSPKQGLCVLSVALALCWCLTAQSQDVPPHASVTFTFSFPGSQPEHYAISVSDDGHATYQGDGRLSSQAQSGEPFQMEFMVSPANRARIFQQAARAHYFDKDLDSKKKGLASTGVKTLAYKDGPKSSESTYNFSPIPAVQDLTQLFQNLSATLEFGHRLEYFHHYQKLALDDELKRLEQMNKDKTVEEVGAISPILQQIAQDPTVINVVRARAQRLLEQVSASSR